MILPSGRVVTLCLVTPTYISNEGRECTADEAVKVVEHIRTLDGGELVEVRATGIAGWREQEKKNRVASRRLDGQLMRRECSCCAKR